MSHDGTPGDLLEVIQVQHLITEGDIGVEVPGRMLETPAITLALGPAEVHVVGGLDPPDGREGARSAPVMIASTIKKPSDWEGRRFPLGCSTVEPHPLARTTLPGTAGWCGRRPNS
jgi:hypothetical protein